ncbi:MAG: hypothetical protein FJ315_05075, partial [SAR202 cluster bacterium]|nr:hypothetical protein [SAR202 cluster bacterium]
MLGDKIGEERGKTTGMRVLPGDDFRHVKLESSFQASGTLLGIQGTDIGTYVSWERVTGQMYAEGQGIFITNDGESTIWNGHGVGRPIGEG